MNTKDYEKMYINNATLTDRQREQRAETFRNYDGKRRKYNIFGGILSGAVTLYVCNKYANIDYTQELTENDKIIIAVVFAVCLMFWRFIRQKILAATTPPDTYGAEEKQAVEELTPKQAEQYIKELDELENAYKDGKGKGNTLFIILVFMAVCGMLYAIKKGII